MTRWLIGLTLKIDSDAFVVSPTRLHVVVSGNPLGDDVEPTNITLSFALTLVESGRMETEGGSPGKI